MYRFIKPAKALRHVKLDNVALVPANLLPFKSQWQTIANGFSPNGVFIIIPKSDHKLRKPIEAVASHLKARGCQVTTISANNYVRM